MSDLSSTVALQQHKENTLAYTDSKLATATDGLILQPLAETPRTFLPSLQILSTPDRGRGVYATEPIVKGTLLDISPALPISKEEYTNNGISQTVLKDYVCVWNRLGSMALPLGLGSIFNHAKCPNVRSKIDRTTQTIHYATCKDVAAGEELCLYYGPHARYGEIEDSEEEETLDGSDSIPSFDGVLVDEGIETSTQAEAHELEAKKANQVISESSRDPEEMVLFKDLPCTRVTSEICLADLPLETTLAWVIDIESIHAPTIFEVLRKADVPQLPLQHLKRIKRLSSSQISVLVHPISPAPPSSLIDLLTTHPYVVKPPYLTPVPSRAAVTREQIIEFASCWPAIFVPIRVGRTAEILSKGWKREHLDWVQTMLNRVERLASEARNKNELPIASLVASSVLGPPLAEAVDQRKSTGNLLCHSVSRVIDAVAAIDRSGGRLVSGQPPPYLLSGLSLFTTHEPCLMCSMSLLHSRIAVVYYVRKSPHAGGLGSVYQVHEDKGLNHKFQAWHWSEKRPSNWDEKRIECDP